MYYISGMYTFQAVHYNIPSGNQDGMARTPGNTSTALSARQCLVYGDNSTN